MPKEINKYLGDLTELFEKNFFDLTKDKKIRAHLEQLNRKQVVLAGCETDVCVLQSCLGLLSLGYEVYLVEELLFSSSRNVESAIARMQVAGAVFLTYKSLYYELLESVGAADMRKRCGRHSDRFPTTFRLRGRMSLTAARMPTS